jgi:hypothetical protein
MFVRVVCFIAFIGFIGLAVCFAKVGLMKSDGNWPMEIAVNVLGSLAVGLVIWLISPFLPAEKRKRRK